jgi:hypothetical protein
LVLSPIPQGGRERRVGTDTQNPAEEVKEQREFPIPQKETLNHRQAAPGPSSKNMSMAARKGAQSCGGHLYLSSLCGIETEEKQKPVTYAILEEAVCAARFNGFLDHTPYSSYSKP